MGDALFELRQKLRSNQDKMTSQEANVIMAFKAKAMREVTIAAGLGAGLGLGVGAGITCLAWRRLNNFSRINLLVDLSVGAALFGLWKFVRSLYSNIEHTLGPGGTRIQMELVNIMLRNDVDDKWTTRLLSKHFYAEKVYDDSSSDQPKLRWRHRNFFADNGVPSQRQHGSDSSDDKIDTEKTDSEKMDVELKQVSRNPGADAIADPLDSVLGLPSGFEEISHPVTSSTSSKRHSHRHKRSHHKHRMRHREVSPNSEDLSF